MVGVLRSTGTRLVTSHELGHEQLSDREQLEFARSLGFVFVTANVADFAVLRRRFMEAGLHHAGIVVRIPPAFPISRQIATLRDIAAWLTPDTARNQFIYLGSWQRP